MVHRSTDMDKRGQWLSDIAREYGLIKKVKLNGMINGMRYDDE